MSNVQFSGEKSTPTQHTPNVGGAPTKYRPEFCLEVEKLGNGGKSLAQIATHFSVCRATIDNWARANPEFGEALNRATTYAQSWWEDKAVEGLTSREFNSQVWKTIVQARFRDDYTERRSITGAHVMGFHPAPAITADMTSQEAAEAYRQSLNESPELRKIADAIQQHNDGRAEQEAREFTNSINNMRS